MHPLDTSTKFSFSGAHYGNELIRYSENISVISHPESTLCANWSTRWPRDRSLYLYNTRVNPLANDSQLKSTSHIDERTRRARNAEIQIKGLTQMHGLVPGLVRQIQLAVVCIVHTTQKIMSKLFKSCFIGRRNRSQECTQIPLYVRYYVKHV